ncbi:MULTISPECIES: AraC family transcriptional regulator [unclassified Chelatococcus]|uniref:helix-turn-helix domain-containing protein n=2 Tax=Chelatococcus TaxID=28209 RepID=UPI001BCE626B|nr:MULTISPECIES: AraC family transcriptional regulator [unclassified Chelatococcus]MBS7740836.1 helix-turn-helix transcriptional regulator [Chelatococcus sp. HY11]MBX3545930.1 helix-turn-helix transcriptional regulator [Chelatococcus sp.]MCO5079554.1 AraC family transcriptional regulator [Chelatococcus sp.]
MNNTSEAVTVHASQTSGPDPLSGTGEGEANAGTARVTADPVVKRMSGALDTVGRRDDELSSVMADALRLAIVTRVLSLRAAEPAQRPADHARKPRPEKSGLQKWRFKRVVDYVSANLGEPITLQDMASVAGLSRMHFAAQFRIATGTRPHEFLLRQRVERAQEMMASSDTPLVAIALDVGFQTQAHFTSVFKRITGETPHRWRGRKELEQARV